LHRNISIVTINLNNAKGLRKTFESVFGQSVQPKELIVIDGGSIDGSRDLIKENSGVISYWTSEPDEGIYNAQNKGLYKASGDYILFLNSGDELAERDTLAKVSALLGDADIIYGDLIIVESSREWIKKYNEKVSFGYFLRETLPHQGSFIKRSVFEKTGAFNETLTICSDWKFFIEAICRYNVSTKYLDFVVARYDYTGISSNLGNQKKMAIEKQQVLVTEFPHYKAEYEELFELRRKYPLLANSRAVKFYFKVRNMFIRDN
jgi:glycosyltransferase involved in cell wall biosynthesis